MSSNSRLIIGISVTLNVLLIIALIFLLNDQPDAAPLVATEVAVIPSATAVSPTQTPFVVTIIATAVEAVVEPTVEPMETAVFTPTPLPPAPTTAAPTAEPPPPSPTPVPMVSEPVYTGPDWLRYVNQFRNQANVPFLVEGADMTEGAANHSYYMVLNSSASHSENPGTSGYTDSGNRAGQNGNIAISGVAGVFYDWPIDYWVSAAFHLVPLLDPTLEYTGYGEYTDASSSFGMAATMDIKSGIREDSPYDQYPITFPRDGGEAWVTTYYLPEVPDPSTACAGYQKPMGAPIVVMLGDGSNTPQILETRLLEDGNPIAHCAFDETDYYNPESYWQDTGRLILDKRDAVVIIPRSPLEAGHQYTAYVNNGGEEIAWNFTVVSHPLSAVVEE